MLFVHGIVSSYLVAASAPAAPPDTWVARSSPSSNQLNGVAFGNGSFVAVGNQATILTSPDGTNWSAQATGAPSSTLWSAAYGKGRYVLGGSGGSLLLASTDAVHWTNVLSTGGTENLRGVTYGYGGFVAVGRGPQPSSSLILTSPDGLNWAVQSAPTTNTLFAVSPAFDVTGVGWADPLYVAVGDRGTIITSTDGTNWVAQHSGATAPLRAVVFEGRFLVGGDSGIVLASSDGVAWPAAAPASFNIEGLASGADSNGVVAVGNNNGTGEVQASTDGLTWPGYSTPFAQPLNAVAFGLGTFVAVGNGGLIVQSIPPAGPTNDWTKTTSGSWEEAYWSLGRLPGSDQSLVAFRNPGFKALAIGTNTTVNFPNSLALQNLLVSAPVGSMNQLLLNYPGLDVPLSINSDFGVCTNASLVGYHAALQGGNFYLSAPAALSASSVIRFMNIDVGATAPGELDLTNSSLFAQDLLLSDQAAGTLIQSGGSNEVGSLQMNAGSAYALNSGTLNAASLDLASLGGAGLAQFTMSGGSMNVPGAIRFGQSQFVTNAQGQFKMLSGSLQADELDFANGTLTQAGGITAVRNIALPYLEYTRGDYFLQGGTLVSGNVALGELLNPSSLVQASSLQQSASVHTNGAMQLYGEIRHQVVTHFGAYWLYSGLLVSSNITLIGGAFTQDEGTNLVQELVVNDAGSFIISGGSLLTSNTTVDTCCCVQSLFIQNQGTHTVQNRLLLQDFVTYDLRDGTLNAANIELGAGAQLNVRGGVISNSASLLFRSGAIHAGSQNLQFGQLQVNGEPGVGCVLDQPFGPKIDFSPFGSPGTTLRFQDSRNIPWSGTNLSILNWSPSANGFGPDHMFVGNNAQALTAAQLSQVTFVNPVGWPPGTYPAAILSTGELVPGVLPPIVFTHSANHLILSWSGGYPLLSATNVAGPYLLVPGATSPTTNLITGQQRYFRLGAPAP